ncbi:MAG: VOC family protein [Hyphomonadaceae bacterium]|nr:VOC family protein [Hyphomonadaceae bacterium]
MPAAISCVTLPVDDVQKSLAFYRDGLGLAPEEHDEDHAAFDLDGVYLVVLNRGDFGEYADGVGKSVAGKGSVSAMLSYFTETRGEVDAMLAKAKAAGASVTAAEDDEGMYSGYFTDPDGHAWEVLFDGG